MDAGVAQPPPRLVDSALAPGSTRVEHLNDRNGKAVKLGRGTFGSVYMVLDRSTRDVVALKRQEVSAVAEMELEVARAVAHPASPHVVEVLHAWQALGHAWYVLPYMPGTLDDEWHRRPAHHFGSREVMTLCAQWAAGAARVHSAGFIHGDLSFKNLFLDAARCGRVGTTARPCADPALTSTTRCAR